MKKIITTIIAVCSLNSLLAQPIQLNPANPHYYLYKGKPTILVTSAEHYGAVINLEFDYVTYLNALAAKRCNYTRIYPGAMFENPSDWVTYNTLGPRPNQLILPWARSTTAGYAGGGNKFDLDTWDPAYFTRLKDFIAKAAALDIIVEICFYNDQYTENWGIQAMNSVNNIQGIGNCAYNEFNTLAAKNTSLNTYQDAYLAKITNEVNGFDNVILEIIDEPGVHGTANTAYGPWISRQINTIINTEKKLAKKHLIAQQVCHELNGPGDFSADDRISVIVAQYDNLKNGPSSGAQWGGGPILDAKYGANKVIEQNETNFWPLNYNGDKVAATRVEAWEFMVGGGASWNQLNVSYHRVDPAGNSPENIKVLTSLNNLRNFIESFDFIKMNRDANTVITKPSGSFARCISEPGKQYAYYIHHSTDYSGGFIYTVKSGTYTENLTFNLPAGDYKAEWINPATAAVTKTENFSHSGGNKVIITPTYSVDAALSLRQVISTGINNSEKKDVEFGLYPNPVNQKTLLKYVLAKDSEVKISVTDISGKEILQFTPEKQNSGPHELNINTSELSKGIYFVKLNADGEQFSDKLIVE